jgi:hypothetical protein
MAQKNTVDSILNRITDLSQTSIDKRVICLGYGGHGVGKTVLMAGIAQALKGDGRVLWLDSSDGYVTLEDWREEGLLDDVDYLSVPLWQDLPGIADAVVNRRKTPKVDLAKTTVVVLDESSSWFLSMLYDSVREAEGLKESDPLPDVEGRHYQRPTQAFLSIITQFIKRPDIHILMTAHEQERGKTEASQQVGPSLPPAFLRGLNAKMHMVFRVEGIMKLNGYARQVQVQPSRKVSAKSRIRGIGPIIEFEELPGILYGWTTSDSFVADMQAPEEQILHDDEDIMTPEVAMTDEAVEVN